MRKEKKYPRYFYVAAVSFPVVLIILLEIILRIAGYGNDYRTFRKLETGFQEFLFFNPDLPKKYFKQNQVIPSVIPDGFLERKPANGFRVFVLGESSVAGFPYPPNASFPRFIKRKLELLHPEKFVEVINLGVSAIHSNIISDITDDIIEQKPDLILIYTGHNEYYGVTGAASGSILSESHAIRKILFGLKEFKIYQMLENFFYRLSQIFVHEQPSGKTLMATMVNDKLVELNSEELNEGVLQFKSNMEEILSKFNSHHIPVISSTLISNDEIAPLENVIKKGYADKYFQKAISAGNSGKTDSVKIFFETAKEYDALRFRAPKIINKTIRNFEKAGLCKLLDAENIFRSWNHADVLVKNYFVDHLHLNIESNRLLGNLFVEKIYSSGILRKSERIIKAEQNIDLLLNENLPFTGVDSAYASYSINILMNSFPFTKNKDAAKIINAFRPQKYSDSLALEVIRRKVSWENAHIMAANKFFRQRNYYNFFREMNAMIEDKPFDKANYYNSVNLLLSVNKEYLAFPLLKKLNHRFPDTFSAKKLGQIYFNNKNFRETILSMNQAKKYSPDDPEIYFTLSAAYFFMKDTSNALINIKRCIELKPDYPKAENIYLMLSKSVSKQNHQRQQYDESSGIEN